MNFRMLSTAWSISLRGFGVAMLVAMMGCSVFRGPFVLERWPELVITEQPQTSTEVTVSYFGVSTLLIQDGKNALLVDGFFSRPPLHKLLLRQKIRPNISRITDGLVSAGIAAKGELGAVLTVHSHYDHAMDVAVVANATGAMVLGSESTANIAQGGGVPKDRVVVIKPNVPLSLGDFEVTFIETEHVPLPGTRNKLLGKRIKAPLAPPATEFDYRSGPFYTIHIAHPQGRALIQGSAGYRENVLESFDADVVFLGIGGLGAQSDNYVADYWKHVIEPVDPQRVMAIHWDNLTLPLSTRMRAAPQLVPWHRSVNEVIERLDELGRKHGRQLKLLPVGRPVPLFRH